MKLPASLFLLAAAVFASLEARAVSFGFGVGVEGGAAESYGTHLAPSPSTAISPSFGLILEERLVLAPIELTLWEDAQLPLTIETGIVDVSSGATVPADYQPFGVGLRVGYGTGIPRPYAGLLVSDSIRGSSPDGSDFKPDYFAVGGDLGLDLVFPWVRFGIELRGYDSTAAFSFSEHAFVAEALLSARLAI